MYKRQVYVHQLRGVKGRAATRVETRTGAAGWVGNRGGRLPIKGHIHALSVREARGAIDAPQVRTVDDAPGGGQGILYACLLYTSRCV